jgi:hypothetical protein
MLYKSGQVRSGQVRFFGSKSCFAALASSAMTGGVNFTVAIDSVNVHFLTFSPNKHYQQ